MVSHYGYGKWLIFAVVAAAAMGTTSYPAFAGVKDTAAEEATCKEIGFRPKTSGFADCVIELLSRREADRDVATPAALRSSHTAARSSKSRGVPAKTAAIAEVALTPNEQTCLGYGFKKGTATFSDCMMQLDQAHQQAQLAEQQYQLQVKQYQQQLAAYQAQQDAIKKERDRRKWAALATFGFGMAGSSSPTLGGGVADGMRALNGERPMAPPAAPPQPVPQNYTVRLPNGIQVYCNYNALAGYLSCR